MKLVQSILTKNPCYTAGRKIAVKGLMLHSVGCPQPKASVFINSWNSPSYDNACVHGFIDGNDGTVYQTLPLEPPGLALRLRQQREREQYPHRGGDVRACLHPVYVRIELYLF